MAPPAAQAGATARGTFRRGPWIAGALGLAAVVLIALRWSDERAFALLLRRAHPAWLLVAAVLQAATYAFQAAVWKVVLARARLTVRALDLYTMSVGKLFIDQAVPSAGMSGTLLIVKGLERRGVARGPVMACVVVETITNFTAFIGALALALGLAAWHGQVSRVLWLVAAGFIAGSAALIVLVLRLSSGRALRIPWLRRLPGAGTLLDALAQAPPALAHRAGVLLQATGCNLAIHLLDAATLWALLGALGIGASPTAVFASFMVSTLARTVGVVPGGLGTFEAASIAGLHLAGVSVVGALAATLLFRGFSFWLPLLPGLWFARQEVTAQDAHAGRLAQPLRQVT